MSRILVSLLASCFVAALLSACGPTQPTVNIQATGVAATQTAAAPTPTPMPIVDLRPLFDYDAETPLDLQEAGVEYRGDVAVHDISYASPIGGRVTAYVVVPPGEGPFAGILFHHPAGGSRASMLDEAVALAGTGAVSILIDAPWARPEPWLRDTNYMPENDRNVYIQNVVDMRRAVDLLIEREDIDPERLGFIGHSYGAHMGAVLAGVETRIRAYVLMAGVPSLSERIPRHISSALPADHLADYLNATGPLDAIHYIGSAAPAALLFQCARLDEVIDEATSMRFYEAGSQPKEIAWYDTGHSLDDQARLDRARWLAEHIGLRIGD